MLNRVTSITNTVAYMEGGELLGVILELPWGWTVLLDGGESGADFETLKDAETWLENALDAEVANA